LRRIAPLIFYCIVLALFAAFALRTPKMGTWDILPYIANAEALRNNDFIHLHRYAYAQLKQHTPSTNFADLTQSSEYRRKTAADPVLFGTGLQFYSIRPLYIMALRLGVALGANPVRSAGLIAALSYFLSGLVVFLWLRAHTPAWLAVVASLLLMLSYPVLLDGRLYTPDAMAAFAMLCSAYLIFERERVLPGLVILLAGIFVRTDVCVFVGFTLLAMTLADSPRTRLTRLQAAVLICVAAASVLAINHFAGNYGYASLMHNQFVGESDPPDAPYSVTPALYRRALASNSGMPAALHGYIFIFLLIALLAAIRKRTAMRDLAFVALLTAATHFVFFPYFHDRLFVGEYLLFAVTAVATLNVPFARALRPEHGSVSQLAPLEIASIDPKREVSDHPKSA